MNEAYDNRDGLHFKLEQAPNGLTIHMGATLAGIDAADHQISALLEKSGAPIDRFAIRILLREAALNAVIHGSGQDPAREVRIRVALEPDGIVLTVEDDGPGFHWHDRASTFDITGDGGRGLALLQIYSTELTFHGRGNRVVLRRVHEPLALVKSKEVPSR